MDRGLLDRLLLVNYRYYHADPGHIRYIHKLSINITRTIIDKTGKY
jgi:hypothetical protein